MKKAYLIVTDLHLIDKILVANRINYKNELQCVLNNLLKIINSYKHSGYVVNLLFLGDIYHRGYTDPTASIDGNNILIHLAQCVNKLYTVVGNHELSYYKHNPFYTLFEHIESNKVKQISTHATQAKGIMQILNIVDFLEDGDVLFHFNHYGCEISKPQSGKINVGLFHQEIINKEILAIMQSRFSQEIFTKEITNLDRNNVFKGYDYCFLGHMHKAYGTFKITDEENGAATVLYYLASLGRTNHSEVQDNFLERNIPAILIEEGHFNKVEDNIFNLLPRSECIRDEIVTKSQQKRKETKEIVKLKNYKASSDNPVQNVFELISNNVDATKILLDLQNCNLDRIGEDLETKIESLKKDKIFF